MKPISFLLDICPIIGGLKMCMEGMAGKEMSGAILVGGARKVHMGFGILTLIIDCFTLGIGGTFSRLLFKIFRKGFLKRAAMRGAAAAGTRTAVGGALRGVSRGMSSMDKSFIGRTVIGSAERKIKRGVEHTLTNVHGYRFDDKKRDEVRKKLGVSINNADDLKNASSSISGGDNIKDIKSSNRFFKAAMSGSKNFVKNRYGYDLGKHKQNAIPPSQ